MTPSPEKLREVKDTASFLLRQMEQCNELMIDAEPKDQKQLRREYRALTDAWQECRRILDEAAALSPPETK